MIIKPTEGKIFAEVLGEIGYKIKQKDCQAEVSFRTKGGGLLVKLGLKTTDKSMFYEAVERVLAEDYVEIQNLDCFTEKVEMKKAIKSE